MYTFDRHITPPPARPKRRQWPFRYMQPGESVLIRGEIDLVYTLLSDLRRRGPHDFVTEKREGGLRVWCIDKADRPEPNPIVVLRI